MVHLGSATPWTPYYFTWPKAILDELLALEVEEEELDELLYSTLAASSASAVYNTLPSMLEEEVPNVEFLPTVAPAVSTALAACFA